MKRKIFLTLGIVFICLTLAGCGLVREAVQTARDEYLEEAELRPLPEQPAPETPAPPTEISAPQPGGEIDFELLGRWEFVSGVFVWYFASHGDIEFFEDGRVMEYAFGEPGVFELLGDGQISIVGEWDPDTAFVLSYTISGDTLTITDHDDNSATWRRVGAVFDAPIREGINLVGRWEFVSGVPIWYFASRGDLEFFAGGRVIEYAWGEPGGFEVLEGGRLRVVGDWNPDFTFYFDIELSGTLLAITDHDGNRAVWRKAAHAEIPEGAL